MLYCSASIVHKVHPIIGNDAMKPAEIIRKFGLKLTNPRVKVLELFQNSTQRHMSAEDVHHALLQQDNNVGLATVYRVLTQFEEVGLLCRNNFDNSKAVYELDKGQHHDHLVCLDCGKVEEFRNPEIEKLQQAVAEKKGYELTEHSLNLYARCAKPNCEHAQTDNASNANKKP